MTKVKLKKEQAKDNIVKPVVMRSCPFCGCKPRISNGWVAPAGVGTAWGVSITCNSKKCLVHPQLSAYTIRYNDGKKLRLQVIETWNKRA